MAAFTSHAFAVRVVIERVIGVPEDGATLFVEAVTSGACCKTPESAIAPTDVSESADPNVACTLYVPAAGRSASRI
jgi:hypothetical protein